MRNDAPGEALGDGNCAGSWFIIMRLKMFEPEHDFHSATCLHVVAHGQATPESACEGAGIHHGGRGGGGEGRCQGGTADWAAAVSRQPAIDALGVEEVGAGQRAQQVTLVPQLQAHRALREVRFPRAPLPLPLLRRCLHPAAPRRPTFNCRSLLPITRAAVFIPVLCRHAGKTAHSHWVAQVAGSPASSGSVPLEVRQHSAQHPRTVHSQLHYSGSLPALHIDVAAL